MNLIIKRGKADTNNFTTSPLIVSERDANRAKIKILISREHLAQAGAYIVDDSNAAKTKEMSSDS